MTAPARPYLPATPYDYLTVGETWCAMTVPLDWGTRLVGDLADQAGPAFADLGLRRATVLLPPGAGEDWPDLSGAAVQWHRAGTPLLVPGPHGHASMPWIRFPLDDVPVFTDPGDLRPALERLLGPLETAGDLGPVALCTFCTAPSRDATEVSWEPQMSGAGWARYACRPCYRVVELRDALEGW